eukprot:jgi/Tetstr1/421997/TSEL_001241.t1
MQPGSARYEGLLAEGYYHYQGRLLMLGSAGDRHAPGAKSSDASAHSASDLWQPLWSDRFMLVVDKGPDLLSVPGKANPECLISGVTQRSDFARARIVHRLDRDTSGCMVLALTDKTHRSLSMAFQDRRDDEGRVDLPIGKNPAPDAPAPRMIIDPDNGRPSSTLYRVLARMDTPVRRTLVELVPLTGRTHQLRLHMKALGHPILGDTLHAPPDVAAECSRLCLHAHSLALEHPVTGEQLRGGRDGMAAQAYAPVARMEAKTKEVQSEVTRERQRIRSAWGASSSGARGGERTSSSPLRSMSRDYCGSSSPRPSSSDRAAMEASRSGSIQRAGSIHRHGSGMSTQRSMHSARDDSARVTVPSAGEDGGGGSRDSSPRHQRRRKGGDSSAAAQGMTGNLRLQLTGKVEELGAQLQQAEARVQEMEHEMNSRQESYIRRERRYKDEISALKQEILSQSSSERWAKLEAAGMQANGTRREQIIGMHTEILRNLEHFIPKVDAKATREADPTPRPATAASPSKDGPTGAEETRDFVERLRDQEIDARAERQSEVDKRYLVEQIASLRKTLEEQQAANHDLKVEANLAKEVAQRVRSQFEYQDDDRESLLRKLHLLKSDNDRLKAAVAAGEASPTAPASASVKSPVRGSASPVPRSARQAKEMDPVAVLSDEVPRAKSLEEVIEGLKQLLMQERIRTRKARAAHTAELQQRTNLQAILRQAIDDTRQQRAAVGARRPPHGGALATSSAIRRPYTSPNRARAPPGVCKAPKRYVATAEVSARRDARRITTLLPDGISTDDLMDEDGRRMLVDSLMAKEEVMKLLFNRAFPGVDVEPQSKLNTINRIAERAEQEDFAMTAAGYRAQRDARGAAERGYYSHNARVASVAPGGGGTRMSMVAGGPGGRSSIASGAGLPQGAEALGGLNMRHVSRPWVMDVDTMLSDFMQPVHGGGGGHTQSLRENGRRHSRPSAYQ